jgi:hypothetical protein
VWCNPDLVAERGAGQAITVHGSCGKIYRHEEGATTTGEQLLLITKKMPSNVMEGAIMLYKNICYYYQVEKRKV